MKRKIAALALVASGSLHCASDAGRPSSSGGSTSVGQGGDDSASSAGQSSSALLDAPDEEQDLVAFLTAGAYASWQKEADFHPSAGPHGDSVRVYYSPKAARALSDGSAIFPAGAAAIKELESGGSVYGWSVWVKVHDASDDGNGFFWYERTQRAGGTASVYGSGRGDRNCVGCHRAGKDFALSTLPFE